MVSKISVCPSCGLSGLSSETDTAPLCPTCQNKLDELTAKLQTERLERAFDSLSQDIDLSIARYRLLKRSHEELLEACKFTLAVITDYYPELKDGSVALRLVKAIKSAEEL